jgi:hypothetical protein
VRARVVTFHLDGVSPDDYAAHCEDIAAEFAAWPGLLTKVWLADHKRNIFGGIYLFASTEAADASRDTEMFRKMVASEVFTDVTIEEYDTLAAPTAVTSPFANTR